MNSVHTSVTECGKNFADIICVCPQNPQNQTKYATKMRDKGISMAPCLLYAHPPTQLSTFLVSFSRREWEWEREQLLLRSDRFLCCNNIRRSVARSLGARAYLQKCIERRKLVSQSVSQMSSFHPRFIYHGRFHRNSILVTKYSNFWVTVLHACSDTGYSDTVQPQ